MRRLLLTLLTLALLTIAVAASAYWRDLASARARLEGHSRLAETSFGVVEYAVVGHGAPVLAVHGAAGGFDQGLDMTGALAGRGYQVIAPSRFGYLRSAMPAQPSTEMQADTFVQLLDRLGVEKVTVLGISAGAWSAIQFAARHPDRCRALVLLVPADYLPPGARIRGGALADAMFKSDVVAWAAVKATPVAAGALSETMLGTPAEVVRGADAAEARRVRQILAHLLPVSARAAGMRFDIATAADRRPYPLRDIGCPVLAISAEDDAFGTAARAREIAAAAPHGHAIVYPTGGHALVGRHDQALQAVTEMLDALGRRTPRANLGRASAAATAAARAMTWPRAG